MGQACEITRFWFKQIDCKKKWVVTALIVWVNGYPKDTCLSLNSYSFTKIFSFEIEFPVWLGLRGGL